MAGSRRTDDTPIALVPVGVPDSCRKNVPRGVHIFSLTYWSRGLRCQALLDVPGGDRLYSLLVELHGGDIWAAHSHYSGFPVNTPAYAATSRAACGADSASAWSRVNSLAFTKIAGPS